MTQAATVAGLCASCQHVRRVTNARDSTFFLCGRADSDNNFVRYPRLPMLRCAGYETTGKQPGPTPTAD